MTILTPWKMYGEYEDGTEIVVGGFNEYDCMDKLCYRQREHGELMFYTGINNEDYVDGEYIGRDNFIYD